jgi:hypothetical protein
MYDFYLNLSTQKTQINDSVTVFGTKLRVKLGSRLFYLPLASQFSFSH